MGNWCILRMSGARTLPVMRSLIAAGIEAWTPVETVKVRRSRGKTGREEREGAMLPTFVFAAAEHLPALAAAIRDPRSPHPAFSIFRHLGRVPLVSDRGIEALRMAERRAVPKHKQHAFRSGDSVRMPDGPFGGMSGTVTKGDGRRTFVQLGGWFGEVEIETFQLLSNVAGNDQPCVGAAA